MSTRKPTITDDAIIVPNDSHDDATSTEYPRDVYEHSTKAVGTQQWVANAWAEGKLPTHDTLRTSRGNQRGYQYPDGRGRLVHYSTLAAVRTLNQLVITNSQDYSKGNAKVDHPSYTHCPKGRYTLPLTQMDAFGTDCPNWKHIRDVVVGDHEDADGYDRLVVFRVPEDDGEKYDYFYRASRHHFDDDELSDRDVTRFLNQIQDK